MQSQIAIAVGNITPSTTHIQELRRTRFDKKLLDDLAASIKAVGVLQAVVVRKNGGSKFELVAGERRWLGAKIAGLKEIPATVHDLNDEQVLEVQLIENLQRENLHELEEAEGYEELMKLKKISADAVADMIGRSRSYVFKRTKLLALCPEARKAFYAGSIDASKAFLIARIVHPDLQKEALQDISNARWNDGDPMSYRDALDHVQRNFMLQLKQAPFDTNDKQLLPKAGSCTDCPKRTGNQKELFSDVKSGDVCTDSKCFYEKIDAHHEGARKKIEATGKKVVHGDAARKIFPHYKSGGDSVTGEYLKMNDEDWSTGRGRKVRDIVGDDYVPIIVQHPTRGTFFELATRQAVAKAAQKPGAKSAKGKALPKSKPGPDVDEQLRTRLVKLIYDKAPAQFNKTLMLALVGEAVQHFAPRNLDVLAKQLGWPAGAFEKSYHRHVPAQATKLDQRDLMLMMLQFAFLADDYNRKPILDLFGINEAKTREIVIAERKKAAADARAAAKKAAKEKTKSKK